MNATTTAPFTAHSQVVQLRDILPPRPVTVAILRPQAVTRDAVDALADEMLRQERQHEADLAADNATEARSFPSRPNRHDD